LLGLSLRISAHVRVVALGVLRRAVSWAGKVCGLMDDTVHNRKATRLLT